MPEKDKITYFGITDYRGKKTKFGIKDSDRVKHVYVIGKTGMGKSTLLENMAAQDILNGNGIAFIDPHGGSAEELLNYVPENRIGDVLYFAPFDMENPVSFNVMEDVGSDKRHLVANGLMAAFKKIWVDAWSARMEYILSNAILALLEYPGSTLLGINRIFADAGYRKKVVANITDPSVKAFWEDEYAKYSDKFATEATAAIQNKVGQFVSNPLIRNIIGQPKSSFDVRKIMDEKKIMIVNLSKGRVGDANANLLGSMLITKIYLAAMSRADVSRSELSRLPNFYLYVDEFQSFANESFAEILSEARKYKLNLTIAHQYVEQMTDEVRAAVFGNVGTFVSFRVGAIDAEVLEKEFAPEFTAEDLVNVGKYQMYLKLMIDGVGSPPFSANSMPPIESPRVSFRDMVVDRSRQQFGQPRSVVEEGIIEWHKTGHYSDEDRKSVQANIENNKENVRQNNNYQKTPNQNNNSFNNKKKKPNNGGNNNQFNNQFNKSKQGNQNIQKTGEQREKELRQAVSLSQLKEKTRVSTKTSKAPSKENMNELKQALDEVLKERKEEVSQKKAVESKKQEAREADSEKVETKKESNKSNESNEANKANNSNKVSNEIPEDVLRKILDVESDKSKI